MCLRISSGFVFHLTETLSVEPHTERCEPHLYASAADVLGPNCAQDSLNTAARCFWTLKHRVRCHYRLVVS
jgi:hypothetical protein